ncbi:MAG: LOG family protein [Bacteroidaceae bacterium]|nr:LOG family protein [Bacteroidaceae bacterium]
MTKTEIIQQFRDAAADKPYKLFVDKLYNAELLYNEYKPGQPDSFNDCFDTRVYNHYMKSGKGCKAPEDEMLARSLHDSCISRLMRDFLSDYPEKTQVGIMGGHGLLRTDKQYADVVYISKRLTEEGFLMISGGGPGAMEATHLGAWMAGRKNDEVKLALDIMRKAPCYKDELWLETALAVMKRFPQKRFRSLGIPTWLYGHEPATPLATHIAKFFDNSIREDTILTYAFGGIIYTPGSAGTVQEIFQDVTQNHYLSFGYSSPMVFFGKEFWTKEMPIYPLLEGLMATGKMKNLLLTLTDSQEDILKVMKEFSGKE